MWVTLPKVILLAFVAIQSVVGDTEPLVISESIHPADEKPVISLEYKPIKPSYLGSGSNVAQIVPPGQPWPANAAGYVNFSQINPMMSTKLEIDDDVPLLQSAPTPNSANMINLDMSNPNTNLADALEKLLAPLLANIKITDMQQTISTTINITPPPNANMDFVKALQAAVRVAIKKLVPSAGPSLRISITKSSSGAIVNVKAFLDIIVPAAKKITPSLPPSAVPEIDLSKTSSDLLQNLQVILLKELSQAGYNANSKSIQNFSLSFSVKPPEGATKDYVRLYILGPLQVVLKSIAPGAAITSVSVNTQESNKKILRQTIKFNVQVVPPVEFEMNENLVEVPEVDLNTAGSDLVSTVITTIQNQIMKNAQINPTQAKTLSIPFKITPPADATEQQIQVLYITPISQILSKLDPTGKILKISQKTLPDGNIIVVIYMNIPANATTNSSNNHQIQPVVLENVTTSKPITVTNTVSQTSVDINNRSSFPEGEEDEIPSEITTNEKSSESAETETTKPSSNENAVPTNAIRTPVVDLTTPTASVNNVQQILVEELSPLSNPVDDGQPKILAIPFKMKPPAGATLQQIEENVVVPIGRLLTTLEPSGKVVTSQTEPLPDGEVESIVYFNIPSVKNSKTYKAISDEIQTIKTSTETPAKNTEAPVTTTAAQEPVIYPITKLPNTQIPNVKLPENTVKTTPINLSHPNLEVLKTGIEQSLNQVIGNNPSKNGEPKTVGFPFVVPKEQATRIPVMAQAIASLLKGIVPSGKALPTLMPKVLPNGDIEFTIYYEIPTVNNNKPSEGVVEVQTKPSISSKIPKMVPQTEYPQTQNEVQPTSSPEAQTKTTVIPKVQEVIPETKQPQIKTEIQPENTVITSPIDLTQPNYANLPTDIEQRVNKVRKISDGKPHVVGIPFVLPKNQKPSFFLTQSLKTVLKTLVPSGNIVQVTEPKVLPNGDNEFIIYDELPAVTNKKPIEEQPISTVTPKIQEVIPETEKPQIQNEVPPKNSITISPVDLKQPNYSKIFTDIKQGVDEVRKSNNGQPQVVGIPFVLPKNQKPSFFLTQSLKTVLKTLVPSGNIVQVTEPKALPNGDTEFIIYDELPAITSEKPSKEEIEKQTKSSVTSKTQEVITITENPQNELPPANAVTISSIDLKQPDYSKIFTDIKQGVNNVMKTNNGQPQVIGIPFVLPKNQKPNFFLTQSLKTLLKTLVPSGNITQVTEPKALPNGDNEFIIYDELPAVNNVQPSKKVAPSVEQKVRPSVEKENKKSVESIVFPTTSPELSIVTEVPKTQNELQPKNTVIVSPINLKQPNFNNVQATVQKILTEVDKKSNGKPQVLGFPFVISKNQRPSVVSLEQAMKQVLGTLSPPGKILPVPQPKVLPNGDVEFIIYYEIPGVKQKNAEITEEKIPTRAVEDVNLDEPGVTVQGEVGKALVKAISTISSNPNDLNNPVKLKFNIYAPLDNSRSQNKKIIDDVSSELRNLEPNAKVVTAKINEKPQSNEPDGIVEILIPSIASSRTALSLKNALKIPTIDINIPQLKLVDNIKGLLQKGLKNVGQLNPKGSQLFDLNFRLNPFDTKGSITEVLKALKSVDPKGQIVSYKLRSGPDGLDYLDVIYLIPKLEDSIIYEIVKPEEPQVIYESFVDIDTRNPLNRLLEKVITEVGAAQDEVQGAKQEQLVNLPLDFRFTNSRGLSDSKVSQIISQTLPSIEGYISQILPDGKIISVDTVALPNSDDVVLKIVVKTPYEPDNTIIIEEARPPVRKVVTTPKPKPRGLFGILGF